MANVIREVQEQNNPDNNPPIESPRLDPASDQLGQSQLAQGTAGQLPTEPPIDAQTREPVMEEVQEELPPSEVTPIPASATQDSMLDAGSNLPLDDGSLPPLTPNTIESGNQGVTVNPDPGVLTTLSNQVDEQVRANLSVEQQRFSTQLDPELYRNDWHGELMRPDFAEMPSPVTQGLPLGQTRDPLDDVLTPFENINPLQNIMDSQGMRRNMSAAIPEDQREGNALLGAVPLMGQQLMRGIARTFYQIPGAAQFGGFEDKEEAFRVIDQTYAPDVEDANTRAALRQLDVPAEDADFGEYGSGVLGGIGYYADTWSAGNIVRSAMADIVNVVTGGDRERGISRRESLNALLATPLRAPLQGLGFTVRNDRIGAMFGGNLGRAARGEEYSFMSPEDDTGLGHTFIDQQEAGVNVPDWMARGLDRLPTPDWLYEGGRLAPGVIGSGTAIGFAADTATEIPTDMFFDFAMDSLRSTARATRASREALDAGGQLARRGETRGVMNERPTIPLDPQPVDRPLNELPGSTPTQNLLEDQAIQPEVLGGEAVYQGERVGMEGTTVDVEAFEIIDPELRGRDVNPWLSPQAVSPPRAIPSRTGFNAPEIPDPWVTPSLGVEAAQQGIVRAQPRPIQPGEPPLLDFSQRSVDDLNAMFPPRQHAIGRAQRVGLENQLQEWFRRVGYGQQRRMLDAQELQLQRLRQVDQDFVMRNWRRSREQMNVITRGRETSAQRLLDRGTIFPEIVERTPFDETATAGTLPTRRQPEQTVDVQARIPEEDALLDEMDDSAARVEQPERINEAEDAELERLDEEAAKIEQPRETEMPDIPREDFDEVWALAQDRANLNNLSEVPDEYLREAAQAYERGERLNTSDTVLTAEYPSVDEISELPVDSFRQRLEEYGVDSELVREFSDRDAATAYLSLTTQSTRASNVEKLNQGRYRFVDSVDELASVEPDIDLMNRVFSPEQMSTAPDDAPPMYLGTKASEVTPYPERFQSARASSGNGWVLNESPEAAEEFAKAGLATDAVVDVDVNPQGSVYEVAFSPSAPIDVVSDEVPEAVMEGAMDYLRNNFGGDVADFVAEREPENLSELFDSADVVFSELGEDVNVEGNLFRQAVDDELRADGYDAKVTDYGTLPLTPIEAATAGTPVGNGSRVEQAISTSNLGHAIGDIGSQIDGAKARMELADELLDEINVNRNEIDRRIQDSFDETIDERTAIEDSWEEAEAQAMADYLEESKQEAEFDMLEYGDLDDDLFCL